MGLLGRYIDGLTDEQRDRIIRATEWEHRHFFVDGRPACLVSHVVGMNEEEVFPIPYGRRGPFAGLNAVWGGFDDLVRRFGLPRIVRACKLRAAKNHQVDLDTVAHPESTTVEPVSAGRTGS